MNASDWLRLSGKRRRALVAGLLGFSILSLACGPQSGGSTSAGTGAYRVEAKASWNGQRIDGEVENRGDQRIPCVYVEYALVDDKGQTLSTVSTTNRDGLPPREKWGFSIDARVSGAKMTRLSKLHGC